MRLLPLAAIALSLTGGAAVAADDPFLSRLVGEWTGRGTMQTSPAAEPERVYCRIANALASDGATLQQRGRCSLASNSGPIDGTISAMGANLYSGSLNSLASRGPAQVTGSASGSRLELSSEYIDTLNGQQARATIVIDLIAGGGYRLISTRLDGGGPWKASEIIFSAQ